MTMDGGSDPERGVLNEVRGTFNVERDASCVLRGA